MINWPSSSPTLFSGDLTLRPWAETEIDFVANACQQPDIVEFTTVPNPYSIENAIEFIGSRDQVFSDRAGISLVGVISGQPALSISLHHILEFDHCCQIGYWVSQEFRGAKLAARCAMLLSDFAFSIGFRRIEAYVLPENIGSQKTLASAGYELESILRGRLTKRDGSQSDGLLYVKFPPVDPNNFK